MHCTCGYTDKSWASGVPGKEYGLYSVGNGELLKIFEEVKSRLRSVCWKPRSGDPTERRLEEVRLEPERPIQGEGMGKRRREESEDVVMLE